MKAFGKEESMSAMKIKKRKVKITPGQVILTSLMFLLALTMLVPILNIIANSFSDPVKSPYMSGLRILPDGFSLLNYEIVLSNTTIVPALFNSVKITVIGTAINILLTIMAAYVLTRPRLFFKKTIMVFLIAMMLIDPGTVPEYLTIRDLGLMGSQWSVILVTAVSVYYLIIMMRYFQAVPKEISDSGAHNQRAHARMAVRMKTFVWLEELAEIADSCASAPVYSILKREDEKAVTEKAYANPRFVEDSVRELAIAMENDHRITWYSVSVTSHESIHNHDAFASVERSKS